jgi:uncharacterized protein with HEPN domain
MKQPKPYLWNIINSVDAIKSYRSTSEETFMKDAKTQDAILMRQQDIGENLIKLRDGFSDFWNENATDEWVKAIGLRNITSHGYADISVAVIWALITERLVSFRRSIQKLL